jgi:LETM1 and EF-hand domain-containing protein 1
MLPRQFQTTEEKENNMKSQVKAKIELAKFLQDTVSLMAKEINTQENNSKENITTSEELKLFLEKIKTGERVKNEDIIKFSKLFDDEITLDNITRPQLVAMVL